MNETRLPSVALRLLGLGTALCLLFGCSPSEPVSGEVSEPVGTPVEVTTVTHGDLAAQARLSGKVAAAREVSILAPLSAKVTAVYVRVGDKVENGQVLFSLMAQYTPQPGATGPMARHVTRAEYAAAVAYMENCGITDGFTQERTSAREEYTPDFDLTGV